MSIIQELKLFPELYDLAWSGKKTMTTRLGLKKYILGQTRLVNSETYGYFTVNILKVEQIELWDLRKRFDIAESENFKSPQELIMKLENIYDRHFSEDEVFTVISFKNILK
jgi:hypothetical protein